MEREIFRDDRHIYLRKCVIKSTRPPMCVFMKSTHGYDILSIEPGTKFEKLDDVVDFGRFLGLTVTEVILNRFHHKNRMVYTILFEMPLVKSLTLDHIKIEKVAVVLNFLHRQEPTFRFNNLETLEILNDDYGLPHRMQNFLKAIKEFIPHQTQILINRLNLFKEIGVEELLQFMKRAKVNELLFDSDGKSNEEMNKFIEAKILGCWHMEFLNEFEQAPWPMLEALHQQIVESISITCHHLPPASITFPYITELKFTLPEEIISLKPLESLINLHDLDIDHRTVGCAILHEPVTLTSLHALKLIGTWSCQECLDTFSHSFMNLEYFACVSGTQYLDLNIFKNLIKNWKFLEEMDIQVIKFDFQEDEFEGFDAPRELVHTLHILSMLRLKITTNTIEKLSKAFPNLEVLPFSTETSFELEPSLENIVEAILPAFKQLTSLQFWAVNYNLNATTIDRSQMKVIIKLLKEHGFPMEVRIRPRDRN